LEVIKDQGNNLMGFVQSYRKFLSVPEPDKELIKAQAILDRVKVLLNEQKEDEQVGIELIVKPKDLELYIDQKQLTQVLLNLGKNAMQSLEGNKNGKIKIIASVNEKGKKYIQVVDNGPGVPAELINEIFVPFFTTKNSGTGIGLSLSKQIMLLHGGTINLSSIPNKQTVFTLVFK